MLWQQRRPLIDHRMGIAAMDLALEAAAVASGGGPLAPIILALDRLLALAAAAPGVVAVHSGDGPSGPRRWGRWRRRS